MGIKIKRTHTHGTKECFEIQGGTLEQRKPADMAPFKPWYRDPYHAIVDVGIVEIGGKPCIVGYRIYSGHWYGWDPDTGQEVVSMTRKFYDTHIAPLRPQALVADPDCVVVG